MTHAMIQKKNHKVRAWGIIVFAGEEWGGGAKPIFSKFTM